MLQAFQNCISLNQNIYMYPIEPPALSGSFRDCPLLADKYIHIRKEIPLDTSNRFYNALVNNYTGINWSGRIVNDLEAPTAWPPL